ncbi:aldo/keto reductase [Flavobacterium sp. SM15]|uniref:aldo/keto reductase n=1 Tax=Flavobacterium sp. SM15 TaxID=2908005 RepID=UPI001EDBEF72|nr:aldo/keto reductase [Flavobacterium sp. SM15]MCG2612352.1 aldo/keto reductase [Flavobacterium sp. SM15]
MRNLGKSELQVSPISLGTFAIGGTMWGGNEEKESLEAIHASIDNGVTSIDTAPFYGLGLSEEVIGKALKGKDRSKVQLLTKFGLVWDGSNNRKGEYFFDVNHNGESLPVYKFSSKENVIKEVEESLKRLNTDYIDLLQLHWADPTTPISETMEAMELLKQQGKIRAVGVSNYNIAQLLEAEQSTTLASNQVAYSMLNRSIEQELIPFSEQKDIGIIAYSPMERGLLTGKYFTNGKLKQDDHRNGYFQQHDLDKVKSFLEQLNPIAQNKQVSLSQLVLGWTIQQNGITTALAGARNAKQALSNAQAMHITFNQEELSTINSALTSLKK